MENAMKKLSRRDLLLILAAVGGGASSPARAQDPVKMNPRSYKVRFENDRVRVLEYDAKPGLGLCGVGKHYHPAHLTLVMKGGKFKGTTEHGKAITGEAKDGTIFWAPAETHEAENVGKGSQHVFIVEVKDKDWKPSTG